MKTNWKSITNYCRLKTADGRIKNVVKVGRRKIVVSDEVYAVYARMGRRERYGYEKSNAKTLSYERLQEDDVLLCYLASDACVPSAEDVYLHEQDALEKEAKEEMLYTVIAQFSEEEQMLLRHLFWERHSCRGITRHPGLSKSTVRYRGDQPSAGTKRFFRYAEHDHRLWLSYLAPVLTSQKSFQIHL